MKIDTNELKRILKIKRELEKELINADMIVPEDYDVINVLYEAEIEEKKEEINKLKEDINEIYSTMKNMVDEIENKKKE